ncbi:hypothetical protein BTO05_00335 [Winogradskyella sp. PC-19]|uniref:hypothetical protein n=1 Tax=unclassified Winogradskyella TaxID=2615021 RepID=UPI000B3C6E4E|nr:MULTISPECIES: hypothetical protein [unclassified Winogradskyella]ARV08160.1 hypothetical protein BTO05_00335 [Winogradskyella sp. PC-19]RZN78719.1 MAG: hypothetical protein EVB12_05175 [Winogradskyella sp.]
MRIRLLLLFLISLLFFNCNTEDDSTVNLHPIVGEWQLIETRDGFSGGSTFYNQNDVVYKFNSDNTVDITSTIPEFESRISTYEISFDCFIEGCPGNNGNITDIITIDSNRNIIEQLDNSNLWFGQQIFDGLDFIFERLP